ncbi:YneF protein [Flavobacterium phage vB_FspM_immuto_3-5A]|uniref:YneF protein n=1 Tax=Flavobacterium phage vB_FspM_immuto_2-6A TaxID=2801477 RepID=A0A7T8ERE5_9CAUD|nr:YneF protein [Flavobacterium phage vB_FspM_immuto_2-6A]QQO91761.1 YneF protein [Flavobacterium phage vB_FspM_immuto_2-6A]QQO91999.1 YneF protein [Flavobacterium phage vB_FspM_immuto_3-5A]QQO92237.1 YneF protein [Flavobacterium phage vB_FspM_immuto_13-6C]
MKDQVINILAIGILALLGFIVVGDFIVALQENRPVDDSVVNLLQVTITGLIGIIGTYFGMNSNNKEK